MSTGPQQPGDYGPGEPPPSTVGARPVSDERQAETAQSREELQRDIEQTRQDLGDTVDAMAQKADVKAQVKSAADEQKAKLRAKTEEVKQKFSGATGGAGTGGGEATQRVKQLLDELAERASRQPLPYLGGALAAGLFIGLLLRGRR